MKKLLTLLALVALSGLCEDTNTLSAWVGRPLTSNEVALAEFESCTTIKGSQHIMTCYAWGICSNAETNTIVPQSACDQVYGIGTTTNVPLHVFALKCQVIPSAPTNSVFTLSANYNAGPPPWTRVRSTDADDVMQWLEFTGEYGVTISNILNKTEYRALFAE